MYHYIKAETLNIFLRYMIHAARHKRFVTYYELQAIFGLSRKGVGEYSGCLGHFCYENNYPLLNSLIVNADNPKPAHGYDEWMENANLKIVWEDEMFKCFKRFHVTSRNDKYFENTTNLKEQINHWDKLK